MHGDAGHVDVEMVVAVEGMVMAGMEIIIYLWCL